MLIYKVRNVHQGKATPGRESGLAAGRPMDRRNIDSLLLFVEDDDKFISLLTAMQVHLTLHLSNV